jgi:hypothetical protein
MKKLEIEKSKLTFIISVLKIEYLVALVSSIFNFFTNKIALANKWMRKIIPSCSNSALVIEKNFLNSSLNAEHLQTFSNH